MMEFLWELAKALFGACGKAVENYPFTTFLVFAGAIFYLQKSKLCIFYENGELKKQYKFSEIASALTTFVVSVFFASFVGYIFNAVTQGVGEVFKMGTEFTRPFEKHPLEFSIILLFFALVEFFYFLIRTRGRVGRTNPIFAIAMAFALLFATYIVTSIYVAVRGSNTAENEHNPESAK